MGYGWIGFWKAYCGAYWRPIDHQQLLNPSIAGGFDFLEVLEPPVTWKHVQWVCHALFENDWKP